MKELDLIKIANKAAEERRRAKRARSEMHSPTPVETSTSRF